MPLSPEESRHEGDALEQSILLLGDGLASGNALKQYETLLRRLPDEPTNVSKLPCNINKNRYRDIAPCKLRYFYFYPTSPEEGLCLIPEF